MQEVAELLGVSSVAGFRASCPGIAAALESAEADLRARGGNGGDQLPWHSYLGAQGGWLFR